MTGAFEWLDPWYLVEDAAVSAALENQLRREISSRHILYGESTRLIARRDALFALANGRVAEVHLTWSKRTEQDPRWPATAIFSWLEEWAGRAWRRSKRSWRGFTTVQVAIRARPAPPWWAIHRASRSKA